MGNLKQEMREMFEKHCAMEFNERNSRFEEGLLEKIINLAFASLSPYSARRWQIVALRAPLMLQKLHRHLNDKRILASSVALLVTYPRDAPEYGGMEGDIGLLSLSLAYAAKYYCVGSFVTREFSSDAIIREFSLEAQYPVAAVAGLGMYQEIPAPPAAHARYVYSDIVKEL
jgi:hypothetical protein